MRDLFRGLGHGIFGVYATGIFAAVSLPTLAAVAMTPAMAGRWGGTMSCRSSTGPGGSGRPGVGEPRQGRKIETNRTGHTRRLVTSATGSAARDLEKRQSGQSVDAHS